VRIRRIEPVDGELLRHTRLRAIADQPGDTTATLGQTEGLSDEHWARAAEANASGGTQATFFAVDDDADPADAVGMVGAYVMGDRIATMVGLWSAPGYRDIGVGFALLEAVVAWATSSGADQLRMWVVERNEHSRRFYEQHGFRASGQTMPYELDPRVTEVEMLRALVPSTDAIGT
jgi:GNAT superfamily N-acetyltransferase